MQNFVEENKLQHGERESPKLRGGKLRFNFIALSLVYFVWNQLTYTTIPKQIVKWNWTTGKIEPQQNVFPQHTCQLSRFSRESPSFSSNIPVSRLEHQISRIKWTFSPFFHKIQTFCIHCTVSGTFLRMFSQWQRLVRHCNGLIPCTSCPKAICWRGAGVLVLPTFGGGGGGGCSAK